MSSFSRLNEAYLLARYNCPCCAQTTISLKHKISARRWHPQTCGACGGNPPNLTLTPCKHRTDEV